MERLWASKIKWILEILDLPSFEFCGAWCERDGQGRRLEFFEQPQKS